MFKFVLFRLGVITGLFKPEDLARVITEQSCDGYILQRREFSLEPRRILLILKVLAFGIVFRRDPENPAAQYDWSAGTYKTRLFTTTIDTNRLESIINDVSNGEGELYFVMKYPCRFLFVFPREAYFFLFRTPVSNSTTRYHYSIKQTPYRFFTKTIDEERYQQDLNDAANEQKTLKISVRDERRVLGMFKQPTAVTIWEETGQVDM